MIGKLRGIVDSVGKDWAVIDVGGVGYEVSCSARTLSRLPAVGDAVTLAVETQMREDQIRLYGFASDTERSWFRLLQGVQGVGAKVALAVLGVLDPPELANAIALQDKSQVARAPGVGLKVAQRIVTELRDRAPGLLAADGMGAVAMAGDDHGASLGTAAADAVSALTNLGYGQGEAAAAVAMVAARAGTGARPEELIRLGLKELAR